MKRLIILIISMVASWGVKAAETDSAFVVKALAEARLLPAEANVPLFFAERFLGRPYVAYTLEVADPEKLVVNTRQLDCTTLVENVTAMTLCVRRNRFTFSDFKKALKEIRYRNGRLTDYTSRLHYFSDWIDDNARRGTVSNISQTATPFTAIQTLDIYYMSRHAQSYKALKKHPEMVSVIAAQEAALTGRRYRYIPKNGVVDSKAMRAAVHDGDIIAITCSKPGLDIAHLGFAVWRSDGLHLLNASQLHKKVVLEPMTLKEYLKKHPSHTGIRIIRIEK